MRGKGQRVAEVAGEQEGGSRVDRDFRGCVVRHLGMCNYRSS